jgi:hypothetical protein
MTFTTAFSIGVDFLAFKAYNKHFIVRAFSDELSEPRLGSMLDLRGEFYGTCLGAREWIPDTGFVLQSGNITRGAKLMTCVDSKARFRFRVEQCLCCTY